MQEKYEPYIRTFEDFPSKGILFYDISPLLGNGAIYANLIADMSEPLRGEVDRIAAFDARGFLFAGAMAKELGIGFTMLRKPGKLPGELLEKSYDLEYGSNTITMQTDAIQKGDRVVLVDDVIATGGTAMAGVELIQQAGGEIVEFLSVIDLPHLGGSKRVIDAGVAVRSLVSFGGHDGEV